jgi:hypothetical protein
MVSNGGFWTYATCGLAITQQALLRNLIDHRAAVVED